MQNKIICTVLIAVTLGACPAIAQVVNPGALQQMQIEEEERRRQMERIENKQSAEPKVEVPAEQPAAEPDPNAVRFFVRRIRFTNSEIFGVVELDAFAEDYIGREQTLADLQALAATINREYRKRGVVTAQAVIPPQNVSSGIVDIRLVEGRLGDILLKGNNTTDDRYITNRIGIKTGEMIDLPSLEQYLLRFNRTNDVQLQAQLLPGAAFSTTDIRLYVVEPSRNSLRVFFGNGGGFSTGEYREGVSYSNHSLLGHRDELSLSTTHTGGQHSYSIRYAMPVNRSGGRVAGAYYQDYTAIRHGTLESLDITGISSSVVLSFQQPVYIGRSSQIDILGGMKFRRNKTWISDVFVSGTDTIDGSIGVEIQRADSSGYWVGSYTYTGGSSKTEERGDYWHGRGWFRRQQNFGEQWAAVGSLYFQNTDRKMLPASEQFVIGGEGTVRGYQLGAYSGNTGLTVTAELHHPLGTMSLNKEGATLKAKGYFFYDFGHVRFYEPPDSILKNHEQLSSIGWGFHAAFGKFLMAKAGYAYGLNAIPEELGRRYTVFFNVAVSIF